MNSASSILTLILSTAITVSSLGKDDPKWTELRTTWSAAPFKGFYPVPTSKLEANMKDWVEMMTCERDERAGYVYAENQDLSTMPFYNKKGQLHGIMLGMSDPGVSSEMTPFNSFTLNNGSTFWAVQAYFRDPALLCDDLFLGGPEKIGDRLWFRVGDNQFYEAPLTENSTMLQQDGWTMGACFVGMGMHYWRYVNVDMNCNDVYPIFLLYNDQKLNAWGIAMAHDDRPYLTSYRWEHPGGESLKHFFQKGDMPTCLPEQGTLSTQHVFMSNPLWDNCVEVFEKIF